MKKQVTKYEKLLSSGSTSNLTKLEDDNLKDDLKEIEIELNKTQNTTKNNNNKKLKERKISGLKVKSNDIRQELMDIANKMDINTKKITFRRLVNQSKPERKLLFLGIFFTLMGSLTFLMTPILIGAIIDSISQGERDINVSQLDSPVRILCRISVFGCSTAYKLLSTAVLTLLIFSICSAISGGMKWYMLEKAGESVVARIRKQLFKSILDQEIGFFDLQKSGELVSRISSDTNVLKNACTVSLCQQIQAMFSVTLSISYVLFLSWKLTLVLLSIIPVVVIVARYYGFYYRKQSKINQDILAHAIQIATESIQLIRTVKSFSKEDEQENLFFEAIDATYKQGLKMARATGIWVAFFVILSNIGIGGVLYFGAMQVIKGDMNSGSLATYVILIIQIGFNFSSFITLYSVFMRALGATQRLFNLIDRKSKISNYNKLNNEINDITKLQLKVLPDSITALVGKSGGGKSSIAKIVMRLYDPQIGNVMIDDINIKNYNLRQLHLSMGYVSQEPVLFGRSIYDNIVYGIRGNITMNNVIKASKAANCHEFISSFPEKYHTLVGERGIRLSGGQKQRVAIARAVLMDPQILVLDEATSALDSESEHLVKQALDNLMIGRTVLVIAHRLSTVRQATKVIVIDNGKLIECGTHDQLIKMNGHYKKLVSRQLFT